MPNGCSDDDLPWSRQTDNWLDTKYPYGLLVFNVYNLKDNNPYIM